MTKARDLANLGSVTARLDEVGNSDGALSNRNMIINGSHIVNQRGITSVTTGVGSSTFTTDRWISYGSGQAVNITIQEVTLPDGTVANSHKTTGTTTTTAWLHPFQKVETFGKGHLRGKPVTISTWVRTNMSGQRIRICDTMGCYEIGEEIPSDGAWHYVTATHTMPSNMAIGASDQIQIHPAFGTTELVPGSYIEFTLTQFELGDTATPFEHRSYGQELSLCERFFQVLHQRGNSAAGTYYSYYNRFYGNQLQFTPMRATPSLSYGHTGGAFYWVNPGVVAFSASTTANFSYSAHQGNNKWGSIEFSQTRTAGGATPSDYGAYRLEASFDFFLDAEI